MISSVQSRWGREPSFDWGLIQHWAVPAHHQRTELCQDDECYWQTCLYYSMFFPNGVLLKTYPMLLSIKFVRFGSERKGRCKTWHLFHLCFKYSRITKLFISITGFIFSHIRSSTRIFFHCKQLQYGTKPIQYTDGIRSQHPKNITHSLNKPSRINPRGLNKWRDFLCRHMGNKALNQWSVCVLSDELAVIIIAIWQQSATLYLCLCTVNVHGWWLLLLLLSL